MESNTAELSGSLVSSSTEILQASKDCGIARKAKVNAMLHMAFENLGWFSPGNLYKFSMKRKPKWVPGCDELLDDFLQSSSDKAKIVEIKRAVSQVSTPVIIE